MFQAGSVDDLNLELSGSSVYCLSLRLDGLNVIEIDKTLLRTILFLAFSGSVSLVFENFVFNILSIQNFKQRTMKAIPMSAFKISL